MSALDDIKDLIRERSTIVWDRIQESSIYNNLSERYLSMPHSAQRGIVAAGVVAVLLFLLSIPYSFMDSASQHMAEFDERRTLIRELLKASRTGRDQSSLRSGPSVSALKNQLDGIFKAANLIPDQIGASQEADNSETQNIIPKGITQTAVSVNLKKLNIRQVTDIGFELSKMHPAVKLFSVDIASSPGMKNYYDVTYKIISFVFPYGDESESYGGGGGMGGGDSDAGGGGGAGDEE